MYTRVHTIISRFKASFMMFLRVCSLCETTKMRLVRSKKVENWAKIAFFLFASTKSWIASAQRTVQLVSVSWYLIGFAGVVLGECRLAHR